MLRLGKAWRLVEARLEASTSTLLVEVEEAAAFWPEESARGEIPVTCHDYVEQMQWRYLDFFKNEFVIVCDLHASRTP